MRQQITTTCDNPWPLVISSFSTTRRRWRFWGSGGWGGGILKEKSFENGAATPPIFRAFKDGRASIFKGWVGLLWPRVAEDSFLNRLYGSFSGAVQKVEGPCEVGIKGRIGMVWGLYGNGIGAI